MPTAKKPSVHKPPVVRKPAERAELSQLVLAHMRSGLSMRKSCEKLEISPATFCGWLDDDAVLAEQYARAREAMMEVVADELLEIADAPVGTTDNGSTDSGAVAKQRLQVDTRRWLLSKLASKKFGDKLDTTVSGPNGGPVRGEINLNIGFRGSKP